MIEKFGHEVVCKYAASHEGILKFLKKLEKQRRRKLAPGQKRSRNAVEEDSGDEMETESTAMSAMTTSKTLRADSIFNLLDSSDEESDGEEVN